MSFLQTDLSQAGFIAARDRSPADTARTILLLAIGLQLAFLLPSAVAYLSDERLIDGVSVWSKPLKFELSIIITVGTVVLLLPLLDAVQRASRAVRWSSHVISIAATLEIAYIVLQAARGRASHFNIQTPAENMAYTLMGIGAVSIVAGCFVVGWTIWRSGRRDAGAGLRLGAASGLMVGAVLTVITAGVLSSGTLAEPGHWVGGVRSDAEGLFLVGWSRSGGDLRVPHFFATHLMQALPLLGVMLDRFSPERARLGVWLGTFAGIAVVAATFVQAASGNPFL